MPEIHRHAPKRHIDDHDAFVQRRQHQDIEKNAQVGVQVIGEVRFNRILNRGLA